MSRLNRFWALIGALVASALIGACHMIPAAPTEHAAAPTAGAPAMPTGDVSLTVLWPPRPAYHAQVIPTNANSLKFEIMTADGSTIYDSALVQRPQDGSLISNALLRDIPATDSLKVVATAYLEQLPGVGSTVLASGSAPVTVLPSTEVTVRVTLDALNGPRITSLPANTGPNTFITITGENFYGETGLGVTIGGVPSPIVTPSMDGTSVEALVPQNAVDGPVVVTANGVSATSAGSLRIIRSLSLSPATSTGRANVPVTLQVTARDASNSVIPGPNVTWSYSELGPMPAGDPPPPSTLNDGVFTPLSTGSFRVSVTAGLVQATADVRVR